MTREAILKEVMLLTPEDRERLVADLRIMVNQEVIADLSDAQREDLRNRLAEYRAGRANTQPWEKFCEELLNEE